MYNMRKTEEINEAFVAGVGFTGIRGFGVGYKTKGIRDNYSIYMKRFDEMGGDISIPVRDGGISVTVLPANNNCMMVIAAKVSTEGETDLRNHAFCHGFIIGNRKFSRDILPYLDSERFDEQIVVGPAERFKVESEDEILFKTVENVKDDTAGEITAINQEEESMEKSVSADTGTPTHPDSDRKRLFYFAVKTILKEGHYLIDCNEKCSSRRLQFTLYDMLPPPLRYQLESCSCGEYGRMLNVLFKCSKPYKKEQSYIKADFSTILSDEYMTYERNYPEIFRLISGESDVRASFYEYMEDHAPKILLKKEKSITVIFNELEKCAREYCGISQGSDRSVPKMSGNNMVHEKDFKSEPDFEPESDFKAKSDFKPESEYRAKSDFKPKSDFRPEADFESEPDFSDLFEDEKDAHPDIEEMAVHEAVKRLSSKRLDDLIEEYIKTGTPEYFWQLKQALFGSGVGEMLRNAQRRRLRSYLESRDANYALKGDQMKRYVRLIMLAYQLSAREYFERVLRLDGEDPKHGPYDYTEIRMFIKNNTVHQRKIMAVYESIIVPK